MILPVLEGVGTLLGGAGTLIGAVRGPQQSAADYASLYAQQLAPGATGLTVAGTELGAMMAPYTSGLGFQAQLAGQQAYDQFQQATARDTTQAGMQAGIASNYVSGLMDLQKTGKMGLIATEMLGPETAASLAKQYATTVGDLYKTTLAGETSLLQPTAQAQAQAGLDAAMTRNKQVLATTQTNLDIGKMQEDTRNKLALQRGQVEGQMALKRMGAGYALAGQRSFA